MSPYADERTPPTSAPRGSLSDALAEVERMALRQAIKRSSFAGPPVESVTIGELAAIIREVLTVNPP